MILNLLKTYINQITEYFNFLEKLLQSEEKCFRVQNKKEEIEEEIVKLMNEKQELCTSVRQMNQSLSDIQLSLEAKESELKGTVLRFIYEVLLRSEFLQLTKLNSKKTNSSHAIMGMEVTWAM